MGIGNSEEYNRHYRDLDLINETDSVIKVNQLWRHLKSNTVYRILRTNIFIQCSTHQEFEDQVAGQRWVAYKKATLETVPCFVRLESEFLDGRFKLVEGDR